MIFVDTSAWYASVVPSDRERSAAASWLAANTESLLTTDYIVDETLTLLRARGEKKRALWLGERFFQFTVAEIHHLDEADIRQAWEIFRGFGNKEWSFTDCSSKVVIERLAITTAFAFDHHFRQFGSISMVP